MRVTDTDVGTMFCLCTRAGRELHTMLLALQLHLHRVLHGDCTHYSSMFVSRYVCVWCVVFVCVCVVHCM